jgi:hypothetical protein
MARTQFLTSLPFSALCSEEELELPVNIRLQRDYITREINFNETTFSALKEFQKVLEGTIRRYTSNSEVIAYLILTHPEVTSL